MTLGLLLGCLGWAALAQEPAAPPRTPRRVLVYTVSAGFEHEVVHRAAPEELSLVERTLVDLGKRTGDFEAVATRDAHEFNPTRLAQFDLVFFYTTGELPFSKDEREALLAFVRSGGAFAGSHCASVPYRSGRGQRPQPTSFTASAATGGRSRPGSSRPVVAPR